MGRALGQKGTHPCALVAFRIGTVLPTSILLLSTPTMAYRNLATGLSTVLRRLPHSLCRKRVSVSTVALQLSSVRYRPLRYWHVYTPTVDGLALRQGNRRFRHLRYRISVWVFHEIICVIVGNLGVSTVGGFCR